VEDAWRMRGDDGLTSLGTPLFMRNSVGSTVICPGLRAGIEVRPPELEVASLRRSVQVLACSTWNVPAWLASALRKPKQLCAIVEASPQMSCLRRYVT
jgi:hypothetical protein